MGLYFAITFGFSWLLALAIFLWKRHFGDSPPVLTLLAVLYMFGPALGAIAAQRAAGQRVLGPLGVHVRLNKWWGVAWGLPFLWAAATAVVGAMMPGVSWSLDLSGFEQRMIEYVPPDQVAEAMAEFRKVPPLVFWGAMFVQPLIAGLTVNAVAGFGEELGWRGFLFERWKGLGFWRASFLVGGVWGVWHAPLILQGHNYPSHPLLGVPMMVGFCVLAAPAFHFLREKTGSVWGASILHGTLNASAGIALMLLKGGNALLVGITGAAGFLVLTLTNLVLVRWRTVGTSPLTSQEAPAP